MEIDEIGEAYKSFKTLMEAYFIAKARGILGADYFKEETFEIIRNHLEQLLPTLSMIETTWIKVYFTDALIFHLNAGLRRPNAPTPLSLTPVAILADEAVQSSQEKVTGTQSQRRVASEPISETITQEDTPIIPIDPLQRRKTAPALQSTPLSVSIVPGNAGVLNEDFRLGRRAEDSFIADIVSQINVSPIPEISSPLPQLPPAQPSTHSLISLERAEVPFLRAFAGVRENQHLPEQRVITNTKRSRSKHSVAIVEPILRYVKQKKNKIDFEDICRFQQKRKTEGQIRKAEESHLYFCLLPGKTRNMIKRIMNNVIIPEGERGYISMERVSNLADVLRAHASQRQISVEQPVQASQMSSSRSPLTPQAILRTSQLQPFTPLRSDSSRRSPIDKNQISNLPTRSLLRQQPLLPIPERDSSIHIPQSPLPVEIARNNSIIDIPPLQFDLNENVASVSNVLRTVPEEIEMIVEQPQVYPDSSTLRGLQEALPLNSSLLHIPPNPENLNLAEERPFSISRAILQDFEMIEEEPVLPRTSNPEEGVLVNQENNVPSGVIQIGGDVAPQLEHQSAILEDIEMREAQTRNSNANPTHSSIPQPDENNPIREAVENNWFEILRPRLNTIEYPSNEEPRRRRKRRIRRNPNERVVRPRVELPVIPVSPPRNNHIAEIPEVLPHFENQIPPDNDYQNLNIPIENRIVSDFPNISTSPPPYAHFSQVHGDVGQQITQTPHKNEIVLQLEKYLDLIKDAGRRHGFANWERFDPYLFKQDDNFEMYTYIFKKIIKNDYVAMDTLYEKGTTRLEAAKGFRLILELKTMGLIDIEAIETRIVGFAFKAAVN